VAIFQSSKPKRPAINDAIDSVIGKRAKFRGELHSSGSINVAGHFEGKLMADGEIVLSQGGKVAGEIQGGSVVISGVVEGNIMAKDTLEITKTGRVHGDLLGGRIIIDEGSSYQGRVKVHSSLGNTGEITGFNPEPQMPAENPASI
jgi:cytoskeletal protein CcmA (bactofilin family)